jgi:hypothetical protein
MRTIAQIAGLAFFLSAFLDALTGTGLAAEDDVAASHPGRAAAHAALTDGADLPATPPSLPAVSSDGTRRARQSAVLANGGNGTKRSDSAREAESQADQHANVGARLTREEIAKRVADASIVAAVRSAAADQHAAAAQARATSAKANARAAGPPSGLPHPPGHR